MQCSNSTLSAHILIDNIEPPSSPTGVHILSIHNGSYYSATMELLWDSDEETGNATYTIIFSANGETWAKMVARENGKTSVTLSYYNTYYRLDIVATNCAGDSEGFTLNVFIGNNINIDNNYCIV